MIESKFRHVEQGAGQARLVMKACYPDEGVLLGVVVAAVVVVVRGAISPALVLEGDACEVRHAAGMDVAFCPKRKA